MSLARVRALVIVGVLLVLAVGAVGWAVTREDQVGVTGGTPCVDSSVPLATVIPTVNRSVTVNVFNATPRVGLAAEVAIELRHRGFTVKTVGNDPLNRTIATVGEVRFGPAGAAAAQLIRTELAGALPAVDDRVDATVDLVLGDSYSRLTTAAERRAERAKLGKVSRPSGLCR